MAADPFENADWNKQGESVDEMDRLKHQFGASIPKRGSIPYPDVKQPMLKATDHRWRSESTGK